MYSSPAETSTTMNSATFTPVTTATLPAGAPAAANAVFLLLKKLRHGVLDVQLPDGSHARFGSHTDAQTGSGHQLHAAMRLHHWNVCAAVLKSGDIGLAESFMAGDWTTPDLPRLLKLFLANREEIEGLVFGSWWGSLLYRVKHLLNRNSRQGSKKNIHAHYDLGNAFYSLWLDPSMNYSSGWFNGDNSQPLMDAQWAKVRRALQEAGVRPGDRVLEIGCGWGALAECAASEFKAEVTGVTLSSEQLAWGQQRLVDAKLPGQLRFQDYRDIQDGPFDAVVSIEMFEAVGREYWADYFQTVARQLRPGGKACIQSITIRDDLFARYVKSTDFIQQYIFPGGLLPSPSEFRNAAARAGLVVVNELDFGLDYAETLKRWREAFLSQDATVRALGFDTRFMRIWEFYLAYCEAAFACGSTSVMQFTLQRGKT
jgi:cyclopropane-fatty-acyl-phospholipid synthase